MNDTGNPPFPKRNIFVDYVLGLLPMAAVICAALWAGLRSPAFLTADSMASLAAQMAVFGSVGMAVVLTLRAKGPDLSASAVAGLSMMLIATMVSSGAPWGAAVAVSLLVCGGIGAWNGFLGSKIPAVFATLATWAGLWIVSRFAFSGAMIPVAVSELSFDPKTALPVFFVCIAASVFLLVLFTRLGVPFAKREKGEKKAVYFLAYVVGACISGLAGFMMLARMSAAHPAVFEDMEFVLLMTACLFAGKAPDNRVFPVLYAALASWAFCALRVSMNLLGMPTFHQECVTLLILAAFGAIAVARLARDKGRPILG